MARELDKEKSCPNAIGHLRGWVVRWLVASALVTLFLLAKHIVQKSITFRFYSPLQDLDSSDAGVSCSYDDCVAQYSFLDLAWWHEGYSGLFPEQGRDYFSWETDPFVICVTGVVPNHIKLLDKKKITIAIIDTGFDVSMIPREMIWQAGLDEEKNKNGIASVEIEEGALDFAFSRECDFFRIGSQYANSHGTLILNLLVGKNESYCGLLCKNDIQVMLLSVLDDNGDCSIARLIDAIKFAEKNGATICNLSLSTYVDDNMLRTTIHDSRMLFVVPAGNDGAELGEHVSYPCVYGYENVISVASLRSDGCISKTSNFGESFVDIAAPGTDVVSITGNGEMQFCNGTSFAVPFVVAEAAMIESNTGASPERIKRVVVENAVMIPNLSHRVQSGGYVNFYIAEP
jgi:subtilisin family serine protease